MASEIHELVVKATPKGIDETTEGLDDVSEKFDETAQQTGSAADRLSGFAKKLKGAMKVAVAGLAVAAAGLLSQVPVIRDLASGLMAVVEGIALRIDEHLRPVLTPLVQGLFELGDAIAAGDWERVEQVFSDFVSAITSVNWGQVLKNIANSISNFVGSVDWAGVASGIIDAIFAAMKTLIEEVDWAGWMDAAFTALDEAVSEAPFAEVGGAIVDSIVTGLQEMLTPKNIIDFMLFLGELVIESWEISLNVLKNVFAEAAGAILKVMLDLTAELTKILVEFWNRAKMGFALLKDFVVLLLKKMTNLGIGVIESLMQAVVSGVNTVIDKIEAMMQAAASAASRVPGVSITAPSLGRVQFEGLDKLETSSPREIMQRNRAAFQMEQRADERQIAQNVGEGRRQIRKLATAMQKTNIEFQTNLDGKRIAKEVEPMLGQDAANAGRTDTA